MERKFNCEKCGLCCRNLHRSEIYRELHDGDGICSYLDLKSNLCTIYENRPVLCNVDLSYSVHFSDKLSIDEYYNLNYKGCRSIWEENRKRRSGKL